MLQRNQKAKKGEKPTVSYDTLTPETRSPYRDLHHINNYTIGFFFVVK